MAQRGGFVIGGVGKEVQMGQQSLKYKLGMQSDSNRMIINSIERKSWSALIDMAGEIKPETLWTFLVVHIHERV